MKSIVIFLLAFSLLSCEKKINVVAMNDKTKIFHKQDCPKLMMANVRLITVEEAKQRGGKPCPNCKPETR
ncbi:MAG: hypothetical protein KGZ58_00080 [Ignavibacteriales bacterium]|nr:hypothetical protein [Ignavibacteriales bacterium]